MLADQRLCRVAERYPGVHRVGCKQAAGQGSLAEGVEQARELLEIDRNTLLIAIGACGADGEYAEGLRSPVERRNQMPVDLVRREALRFVCAEQPVRDEYGAFTDCGIRDQVGIDLHGDVQPHVLGVGKHEVAEVASIGRRRWDGLGLSFDRGKREDLVRRVEDAVLCVGKQSLAACAEKSRGHRTHLLTSTQALQDQELGFELFEPRKIELGGLGVGGQLPRTRELEPDASLDRNRVPLPTGLGVLSSGDRLYEPISFDRIAVGGRTEKKPRRAVQTA